MAEKVGNSSTEVKLDLKKSQENLAAKKEKCLTQIEIEFQELFAILNLRKLILREQVEQIINEMSNQFEKSNEHKQPAPNIVFSSDLELKNKLKSFGDINRKTQLQVKSPPPLNTLSPVQNATQFPTSLYTYQHSPYLYSPGGFQAGVSIDEKVRDAHPSKLTEITILTETKGFKPLCIKKFGELIYAVSQDEFIYIISAETGEVLKRVCINFGLFFPAITVVDSNIIFGHSSQFGGKIWMFSPDGVIMKEIVELPNYGRIKLLSDLDAFENRILIVDSDNNAVLITSPDLSKVEERIGRNGKLISPTRVVVNTNNEVHILHRRGTTIDVYNLKDDFLRSFYLRHQTFASEHIRYNPDLLITDKYLTLIFDNLIFVYNFNSGIFSQAKLDGVCGVIPKCLITHNDDMIAVKHDSIMKYNMNYFD